MICLLLVVLSLALFAGGATEGSESVEARGRQRPTRLFCRCGLFFITPCFLMVRPQGFEPWTR